MEPALVFSVLTLLVGVGIGVAGLLARSKAREQELADVLLLPFGETDVDLRQVVVEHGPVVSGTLGLATKAIDRVGSNAMLRRKLEQADLSIRPAELVVASTAFGLALGLVLATLTRYWWTIPITLLVTPALTMGVLGVLAGRRSRAFAAQLPDALVMISSSLAAGHTFMRSIQMMAEEADQPLAGEFERVINETQLGLPLVDSLDRMAQRLELRDLDWMVQALRIQQQVGGQLADLLATLAEFMRAREEVRREVRVLTAEGRISAWVLGAMPIALFLAVSVINPGYVDPLLEGWGLVWSGLTILSMAAGVAIILRMVKQVEV